MGVAGGAGLVPGIASLLVPGASGERTNTVRKPMEFPEKLLISTLELNKPLRCPIG